MKTNIESFFKIDFENAIQWKYRHTLNEIVTRATESYNIYQQGK